MTLKRQLGNSDLHVAPLTFGGNVFGWTVDEPTSFRLLDSFIEAGFNFIDTADSYSHWAPGNKGGESETVIGNWHSQRGNRDKIIIATKVGTVVGENRKDISKAYILKSVEASLKRLKTDYIDLYQTHWDNYQTPVEETLQTYDELIKSGKVRWIGASNLSPQRLKDSLEISKKHGYPSYISFQPLYNLYDREVFEKELEQICLDNHIGVINYYALASGFLSGKYRSEADLSKSVRGQGNKKYLNERGLGILTALDEVAKKHNTAVTSVAIAWLLTRNSVTAPIASATNTDQLNALIKATELKLDDQSIALLNNASKWQVIKKHD